MRLMISLSGWGWKGILGYYMRQLTLKPVKILKLNMVLMIGLRGQSIGFPKHTILIRALTLPMMKTV